MKRFLSWCSSRGVTFPKLTVETRGNRRGLYALHCIQKEEMIATIPKSAVLTGDRCPPTARFEQPGLQFGPLAPASLNLAMTLTKCRLERDSQWAEWIEVLPSSVPNFLNSDRSELQNTLEAAGPRLAPFHEAFDAAVQEAQSHFSVFYESTVAGKMRALRREIEIDTEGSGNRMREEELFRWALSIVCSRGQSVGKLLAGDLGFP